jgi:hypothetical protein
MDDDLTVDDTSSGEFGPTVDTGVAVAPSATDGPAAVTPPGRSRLAVAVLVAAAFVFVGAAVFGVLGFQAKSDASDQRDRAAAATVARRTSLAREHRLDTDRQRLEDDMTALPAKYDAIDTSIGQLVDAHNAYIDVEDKSTNLYNSGDTAGAVSTLQSEGPSLIAALDAKQTASQQAVQAAEDALHQVQEEL